MYISKRGFVIKKDTIPVKELSDIKKELRARPLGKDLVEFYDVFIETKTKIYIPKMYGINKFGFPKTVLENYDGTGWTNDIQFKGKLFDSQLEPVECLYNACINNGGGILNIQTGGGKTTCALQVLSRLKGKTIIVVNKTTLLTQWKSEIEKFLPDATIGIIQGRKNIDVSDKDIIIAMLQSLSRIDYPESLFESFMVTIIDEIHNTPSTHFSKIFFKITSKYTIGLSATTSRSDGCEYVFKWHIGDIVYTGDKIRKGKDPIIQYLKIDSTEYKEIVKINQYTGARQIQFTSMLSELITMKKRNLLIIELIKNSIRDNRKILVLSDRRNHLEILYKLLDLDTKVSFTYGLFLGAMKEEHLNNSKACDVILATFAAFGEGISEKDLDTLILCTPKKYIGHLKNTVKNESGKLEQIVGRIFRKEHKYKAPLIIDLQDNFSVYKNQSSGRRKFYKEHFEKSTIQDLFINLDEHDIINFSSIKTKKSKSKNDEPINDANNINKFIILE